MTGFLRVVMRVSTTAAPPRRECARRGPDPVLPPNRKDETMQDTVDQAHGAVSRALADIMGDTRRAVRGRCRRGRVDSRVPAPRRTRAERN